MKKYLILLSLIYSVTCISQTLTINIPENNFGIDESLSLIVSRIQNIENYHDIGNFNNIIIALDQIPYRIISNPNSLEYSNSYLVEELNTSNQYTLYFTLLPIILIESSTPIGDDPKVLASLIYTDHQQSSISNIGIELRGGSSLNFPKKNFDIEFWKNATGNDKKDMQFGELREDDDWILDALYNEPLRLRSYIANKLWMQMFQPNYTDVEPNAKSGADVMYVETFLNGQYNGIYNLSEQVDRKQLKLKKYNGNIRGELYKGVSWGAPTFTSLPAYDNSFRGWSGYELEYPEENQTTNWNNLFQFTDFVMNSSELDFKNEIWTRFTEDNFVNYFLFLNLIRATDNTGKNIYLGKYDEEEPYFYIPWDLDGCFGTDWNGSNENITDDILTNSFMERVINENPNNTFTKVANTWFDYRKDIFSLNSLSMEISQQYHFLNDHKIYERESLVYPNYSFDDQDLIYTIDWLENRLDYLDIYFRNALSINAIIPANNFSIFPNPGVDKVYINSGGNLNGKNYQIFNSVGQQVSNGTIDNELIKIDELENGVYYIIIESTSFKLIKK